MTPSNADPLFLAGMEEVTSYAEANEILRNPGFAAGGFEEESLPFRARTLLEIDGDDHARRRKLEACLFTTRALDSYERHVLDGAIGRCLAEAAAQRGSDGVVRADLVRLTRRIFLQVAAAVIGLDAVDTPQRTDVLETCMYALNAAFDVKFSTREHTAVVAEGLEAKGRFVDQFYAPSVARRRDLIARHSKGEIAERELPADLLTVMMQNHNPDWDDDLPVRESILYLAGATETTSNAITHAVVDLLEWLEAHPKQRSAVVDARFLRGACNEALRLHSNVTALARRATRDITLATGRSFSAGQLVAVSIVEANRDKSVFGANADQFDPWREVPAGVRPYGLVFGAGRHVCVGLPMTTTVSGRVAGEGESDRMMLKILLALLASGVRLDPDKPPEYLPTVEKVYASLPVLLIPGSPAGGARMSDTASPLPPEQAGKS